jgi:hypothetical protein
MLPAYRLSQSDFILVFKILKDLERKTALTNILIIFLYLKMYYANHYITFPIPGFLSDKIKLLWNTCIVVQMYSKHNTTYKYYVSGHYPLSCFYLKTQRFEDWILSPSSS